MIKAGGAPEDFSGAYQWYYTNSSSRSPSWTGVNQFRSYILGNDYTGPDGNVETRTQLALADVVQFNLSSDAGYEHGAVVTRIDPTPPSSTTYRPVPYISYHSGNTKDEPLSVLESRAISTSYIGIDGYWD